MTSQVSQMIGVFQSYKGSNSIMDMHRILIENIQLLREEVLKEDWKKVKILAASCLGLANGAKRLLENEGDVIRVKMDGALKSSTHLDEILKEIVLSGNHEVIDAVFTPIKESLVQFPDELAEFEIAFQKLENGETENVSLIKSVPNANLISAEPVQLTLVREIALACASRGLLGLIHADFNLSLAAAKSSIGSKLEDFDANSDMLLIHNEYSNNLHELKQQLYQAMAQPNPEKAILNAATELLNFIERKLPVFTRSQAWMCVFAKTLQDKGKGGLQRRWGKLRQNQVN